MHKSKKATRYSTEKGAPYWIMEAIIGQLPKKGVWELSCGVWKGTPLSTMGGCSHVGQLPLRPQWQWWGQLLNQRGNVRAIIGLQDPSFLWWNFEQEDIPSTMETLYITTIQVWCQTQTKTQIPDNNEPYWSGSANAWNIACHVGLFTRKKKKKKKDLYRSINQKMATQVISLNPEICFPWCIWVDSHQS